MAQARSPEEGESEKEVAFHAAGDLINLKGVPDNSRRPFRVGGREGHFISVESRPAAAPVRCSRLSFHALWQLQDAVEAPLGFGGWAQVVRTAVAPRN